MALQTAALETLAVPLALLVVGAGLLAFGYRLLRPELRRHRSDPLTVREAETADGLVELRGTAAPHEHTLEAPFTGTDCLAYRYEVEEYQSAGKHSHWETLASGGQFTPFRLEDDTGSLLVEPEGDDFHFDDEWHSEVGPDETVKGRAREFLASVDVEPGEAEEFTLGPLEVGTGDRRRYSEERLDVDESVSVYGPVEYDPAAGGDWGSDQIGAVVRRRESDEQLVVADTDAVPTLRTETYAPIVFVIVGAALSLYGVGVALETLF